MATAKQIRQKELENPDDPNVRDPEHAHELGGTLGMAAVGVPTAVAGGVAGTVGVTAGTALGAAAGPIGIVAGAAIGGALGGMAGEALASLVNPTAEEKYWEENYQGRPYVIKDRDFNTYRPAYRVGIDAYRANPDKDFESLEPSIRNDWGKARGDSDLEWNDAREAARDAFGRLETQHRK